MATKKEITLPYDYTPRPYQMPFWKAMRPLGDCRNAVLVWHRRCGKDKTVLNYMIQQMYQRVGVYYYFLPTFQQARRVIWENIDRDGPLLHHFPADLIANRNETDMKIVLRNGSIFQLVGTDNYDSVRGTNPVGCVFSEYSEQDPGAYDVVRPILLENGGFAIFVFTPKGQNHSYKIYRHAETEPGWFAQVLGIDKTGVMSERDFQNEVRAGMDEDFARQEFYCAFNAGVAGAFYAKHLAIAHNEGRITKVPYEPRVPVHTAWDLGMDDAMAIWLYQRVAKERRFIDYIEGQGEGLPCYIRELKTRPYIWGQHYAPHDINVRELGTGKSRWEIALSLGLRFTVVPKQDPANGIEAARMALADCWFDADKCEKGVNALREYQKEYDEHLRTYKKTPLHNWASHAADAFRTFATGDRIGDDAQRRPVRIVADFDPFTYEKRRTASRAKNEFNPYIY